MEETKQTNYTVAEGYELPSGGKIYSDKVNSHVELRSMTARDEMKRLSPSTTQFKRLADIIEGCMIEKPAIHVYDMALGDYEFLLHKLRIVTYGPEYKMALTCPYCGKEFETTADLEQLSVKDFDQKKFDDLQSFTLPMSGDSVKIKFETPRMLDEIEAKTKEMKRKYREADIEFDLLVLLEEIIDEVNGEKLDPMNAESYINKLPAKDMTKIINNLDALNSCIGLSAELLLDCPECGREVKTFFRFGSEFFRPTTI
jgi:endogenous inhibitor of DNA gyrase (YacG/DUF329 family)